MLCLQSHHTDTREYKFIYSNDLAKVIINTSDPGSGSGFKYTHIGENSL